MKTILLLTLSNVFMTFAWYGHLKTLNDRKWYIAAIASWGIALFEYLLQVPANRIGFQQAGMTVAQLKIIQEAISLENGRAQIGAVAEVLVEGAGRRGTSTQARTRTNRIVHLREALEPGTFVSARIMDAAPHHLSGEVVPASVLV